MTTTLTVAAPVAGDATKTSSWDAEFQRLRERFPKVKPTILFCLHILQQDSNIHLVDLKARAGLHGLRVTAASVTAARRLMAEGNAQAPAGAAIAVPAAQRQPRRVRAADAPVNTEKLVRQMVGRIQSQGAADNERLKAAVRKAMAILEAAVS